MAVIACTEARSAVSDEPYRIVYQHGVSSHQEGADARASTRPAEYGNSSV
jgi:hypothetical protein